MTADWQTSFCYIYILIRNAPHCRVCVSLPTSINVVLNLYFTCSFENLIIPVISYCSPRNVRYKGATYFTEELRATRCLRTTVMLERGGGWPLLPPRLPPSTPDNTLSTHSLSNMYKQSSLRLSCRMKYMNYVSLTTLHHFFLTLWELQDSLIVSHRSMWETSSDTVREEKVPLSVIYVLDFASGSWKLLTKMNIYRRFNLETKIIRWIMSLF